MSNKRSEGSENLGLRGRKTVFWQIGKAAPGWAAVKRERSSRRFSSVARGEDSSESRVVFPSAPAVQHARRGLAGFTRRRRVLVASVARRRSARRRYYYLNVFLSVSFNFFFFQPKTSIRIFKPLVF